MKNFPSWNIPLLALTAIFGVAVSSPTSAQTLTSPTGSSQKPELPRVRVDVPAVSETGRTIAVHARGNLQSAIDSAAPGDQIVIDPGITLTGNFVLRRKAGQDSNTKFIVIRSNGTLPPSGTRITPNGMPGLARLQSNNSAPVLTTEYGAHHYRIIGLEITKVTDPKPNYAQYRDISYGLVWIGGPLASNNRYPGQASELPHHIILDRCYVHGDYNAPHGETYRGVMVNGNHVAVVDSYISNIHSENLEVQGIEGGNSNGPIKILNNYIEAAGENIIFGGFDPNLPNATPSDIEIRHNYLSKPLTWNPYSPSYAKISYSVKNLLELKNATRVLIDGNIMENNWVKSQDGKAILFTVRNQSGNCAWCAVQDITFTNNIVRQTAGVFNMIAVDYNHPSKQTQRILIQNNEFYSIGGAQWGDTGSYGTFASVNGSHWPGSQHYTIMDLVFDHNTALPTKNILEMDIPPAATNVRFTNNLMATGAYGIFGSGSGNGTPAIKKYIINPVFQKNVFFGDTQTQYPSGITLVGSLKAVRFVDVLAGNLRLRADSPYIKAGINGTAVGADFTQLENATRCVMSGVQCQ